MNKNLRIWPPIPAYRILAAVSYGSGGWSFNLGTSVGLEYRVPTFNHGSVAVQSFVTTNFYLGGSQLGTSPLTKGIQYDLTATVLGTFGGGNTVNRFKSHNMYSINSNILSPFKNNYKGSVTIGPAWNYNSAISKNRGPNFGALIQRSTVVGFKSGNFSLQFSNDTKFMGADGGDRANTGHAIVILKSEKISHELAYENFTGAYDTDEESIKYPNKYPQNTYHKSLNRSFYSYKFEKVNLEGEPNTIFNIQGGKNNGFGQNVIHSWIGTAKFDYANDWRINIGSSIGFYGTL